MSESTKKKKWYQQKTFWAGIAMIATGAVQFAASPIEAVTSIIMGLGGIFMRQAVEESKPE
jgi:hypothetical protein